jgi:hypothetical protein
VKWATGLKPAQVGADALDFGYSVAFVTDALVFAAA